MKHAALTMIVQHNTESGWYVGQIEEFPAAISQGKTIDELRENLIDTFYFILETQKEDLENKFLKRKHKYLKSEIHTVNLYYVDIYLCWHLNF